MDLQKLIERTKLAANHADFFGLHETRDSLISIADQLKVELNAPAGKDFPRSGDNFANVVSLTTHAKFTIH